MAKTAEFALLESPKWISRKILVIEKSVDFHTVGILFPYVASPTDDTFFIEGSSSSLLHLNYDIVETFLAACLYALRCY